MIPLENQLTSLEPSIRLKELGVKQDSYWVWINPFRMEDLKHFYDIDTERWNLIPRDSIMPSKVKRHCYAAFTVAEHGIALPRSIRSYRDTNSKEEFWVCKLPYKKTEYADTEANARAQMRIWLIENKLVEME